MPTPKHKHFLSLLASYLFLLAMHGYIFGHGDTVEVYPYAKWMMDPTLYPKDFHIQNTVDLVPNPRYLLAVFFSWTGSWMPWIAMLLHFVSCTLLLEGLYRIGKKYIKSDGILWMTILVPITLLYSIDLGGNEMYVPFFTSSTFSLTCGVWAILFFLNQENATTNKNYWWCYGLLSIAGFIQPLVSIQLFVILTGILFCEQILDFKKERLDWKPPIIGSVAYLLTAGMWVYLLNSNFTAGTISNADVFEFFEFRIAHHYMPSYFPLRSYILLIPLFIVGTIYFFKNQRRLFLFFVMVFIGMIVFTIGVEVIQHPAILTSQWFKSTMWLKAFSFFAVAAIAELMFPFLQNEKIKVATNWALWIAGALAIVVMIFPSTLTKQKYDFPVTSMDNPERTIAEIAKTKTPKDALFAIPIRDSHFKYYSERSSYVEYKAISHRKTVIPKWNERIREIYEIDIDDRRSGKNLNALGEENYRKKSAEEILNLKTKGVDYWITYSDVKLPFEMIGSNEKFVIYKLP